jgi:hypothetical protein
MTLVRELSIEKHKSIRQMLDAKDAPVRSVVAGTLRATVRGDREA